MNDEKTPVTDLDADRRAEADAADDTGLLAQQEELTRAQLLGDLPPLLES